MLIGTVTNLALVMEEHRAAHRVAGLALVQPGMARIGSPADLLRAGGEHRVRQAHGRHRPFTWAGRLGSRSEATNRWPLVCDRGTSTPPIVKLRSSNSPAGMSPVIPCICPPNLTRACCASIRRAAAGVNTVASAPVSRRRRTVAPSAKTLTIGWLSSIATYTANGGGAVSARRMVPQTHQDGLAHRSRSLGWSASASHRGSVGPSAECPASNFGSLRNSNWLKLRCSRATAMGAALAGLVPFHGGTVSSNPLCSRGEFTCEPDFRPAIAVT